MTRPTKKKPGSRRRAHWTIPRPLSLNAEQIEAILTRLRSGQTALIEESRAVERSSNNDLRHLLKTHLGAVAYEQLSLTMKETAQRRWRDAIAATRAKKAAQATT